MLIKKLQGPAEKRKGIYYEYDADSAPVGEGGMGVVYRGFCVDEKTGVSKEVAIKVLHTDLPEEVYARAEREAAIQLRHDNLVEMLGLISEYEINRWKESICRHYVISEFLHGVELSDLLAGRLDCKDNEDCTYARELFNNYLSDREKTSIFIIKNILSGVLALHDKGYIHRDIDPSNIMVTNDGCIKLIDFGISKNLNTLNTNDKLRTAAGKFIGKAEYASPELVLGDVRNQNRTTDIYALGILFYRLLAGQLPFDGSQYEILQHQLKSRVPVKNIDNKALANVIRKSTEKVQSKRYSSIAEFRVAIDEAETKKQSVWDIYGKYIASFIILAVLGIGLWKYLSLEPAPLSPPVQTQHEKFLTALSLLDSKIPDSVRLGFTRMQEMAKEGYDSAKVEVGITYLPRTNNELIKKRRECLNLVGEWESSPEKYALFKYWEPSANQILDNLTSIADTSAFTPDVYYIQGIAHYLKEEYQSAMNAFEMALKQRKSGKAITHGFDHEGFEKTIANYIRKTNNKLQKQHDE